jgi:ABC-type bacteriocin transporter
LDQSITAFKNHYQLIVKKGIKIKQRDISDCGAACLCSVSAYYKLHLPVSRVRQFANTERSGTNVLGMVEACEKLGFLAKGAKGPPESLAKIPLPAIAHVITDHGIQHFVVIYRIAKTQITFMDPADGLVHKEDISVFLEKWSGTVIVLIPGEDFSPASLKAGNARRFWELVKPHKSVMLQALVGAMVYTILGLSTSIFMQKLVDIVIPEGNLRLLNLLSIGMIIVLIFQIFIGSFKTILGIQTGQHIDAKIILGYYRHLFHLPQRFFDTMRVGEIISRLNDAIKIRSFVNDVALSILLNILIVSFSIALMFLYYWKLALIMLCIVPFYIVTYIVVNKVNKRWNRKLMENAAELDAQVVQTLHAAATIKKFGLEEHVNLETENRFMVMLDTITGLRIGNTSDFITKTFTIVLLWAGGSFVVSRELTPGELLSFYALIGYFIGPAQSLISANRSVQDAMIAADRLFEIIDLEIEDQDDNKLSLLPEHVGDIVFKNVSFRYGSRDYVFEGFNVNIVHGTMTAFVGSSGCGKSTLLSLLQNLYPINEGKISIGNIDIKNVTTKSLRNIIAVVPQQIDLFSKSIVENVAIGDPEPDIFQVMDLCQKLGISDFIEEFPEGYNTILNENGNNLSGGQRQKLAIARALYRKPEILILDEATAALDAESEKLVFKTLLWFKKQGNTVIVIAHRLVSIKNADQIIVLKDGKLQEQGTHGELMSLEGDFYNMWQTFHSGAELTYANV